MYDCSTVAHLAYDCLNSCRWNDDVSWRAVNSLPACLACSKKNKLTEYCLTSPLLGTPTTLIRCGLFRKANATALTTQKCHKYQRIPHAIEYLDQIGLLLASSRQLVAPIQSDCFRFSVSASKQRHHDHASCTLLLCLPLAAINLYAHRGIVAL